MFWKESSTTIQTRISVTAPTAMPYGIILLVEQLSVRAPPSPIVSMYLDVLLYVPRCPEAELALLVGELGKVGNEVKA